MGDAIVIKESQTSATGNIECAAPAPFFTGLVWNGGGRVRSRLNNPILQKIINEQNPDIFAYGEAQANSPRNLNLNGYSCHLHQTKQTSVDNFRRGLAIFYLDKHKFRLSKCYASAKYDIVWMRLQNIDETVHFCFFYSPGAHHPKSVRTKFYDIFCSKFSHFASLGKVYLLGDTNARLGSILGDKDIHGKFVKNQNMPLFMEFLEFSGVTILDRVFCRGSPTYEIVNKKRCIIDLCMTHSLKSAESFKIKQTPLGVNSQTCQKPLSLSISLNPPPTDRSNKSAERKISFRSASKKKQIKIAKHVSTKLSSLIEKGTSPDYFLLKQVFSE